MKIKHDLTQMTQLGVYVILSPWGIGQLLTVLIDSYYNSEIGTQNFDFLLLMTIPLILLIGITGFIICRFPTLKRRCFKPDYLSSEQGRPYYLVCIKIPLIFAAVTGVWAFPYWIPFFVN